MNVHALGAIVRARLRAERRTVIYACATAIAAGFIQPHGIARLTDPLEADLATRSVWLAGPMFFCSIIGMMIALFQGPGRHRVLDLCELGAPLFGRELARAKALVPVISAMFATLAYWFAQFLSGFAAPPTFFVLALAAVFASSLVALNATIRSGPVRWLYIALGFATSLVAYLFAVYADAYHVGFSHAFARYDDAVGVATELAFCAIVGFVALRQYGEALARYNPPLL